MATLASSKIRITTLLAVARGDFYMNNMGGKTTIAAIEWLESNGYVDFKTTPRDGYLYFVTPKGVEALDAHMPIVDQPQPVDETTIEGPVSFYADGKPQDGTIVCGTDRYGYTIKAVSGKVYDEVQRSDIEPRLADEIDDLPFSDVGQDDEPAPVLFDGLHVNELSHNQLTTLYDAMVDSGNDSHLWIVQAEMTRRGLVDDEDTKPIPAVTIEPKPTLSNLIDAALNPDDTAAYDALKAYDWASVPLWVLEIERDAVNKLAWDLWRVAQQQVKANESSKVARNECQRAFDIKSLLNQTVWDKKGL